MLFRSHERQQRGGADLARDPADGHAHRAEAKSASDQLRSLKKDTGDGTGILDSYLEILDKFVAETDSYSASATNKGPSATKSVTVPAAR